MKILLEKLKLIESMQYVGNCVDSFDEDGQSLLPFYNDVSDFAYHEENYTEISKDMFLNHVDVPNRLKNIINSKDTIFFKDEDNDILILYDSNKDIHYFFNQYIDKHVLLCYRFPKGDNNMEEHDIFLFNIKVEHNSGFVNYQTLKKIWLSLYQTTDNFSRTVRTLQKERKLTYIPYQGLYRL